MRCSHAVILAGGAGTRLSRLSPGRPKALTPVHGKPVIDHLIETFLAAGINNFLLLLGVGADAMQSHVQATWQGKAHFSYSVETIPRGTGGALMDALPLLPENFFLCFGDVVFRTDLSALDYDFVTSAADIVMTVHPNDHPFDSDGVVFAADKRVTGLSVAPHLVPIRNRVNAGVYAMRRAVLTGQASHLPKVAKPDLEKHIVAPAVGLARVFARELTEYLRDMGTPERLALAERDFATRVPERLSDPHQRAGFFIARDRLFDLTGSLPETRPDGVAALKAHIGQGFFPVVTMTAEPAFTLEKLDEVLGRAGAFVWDYVVFPTERPDLAYFTHRQLVAEQSVFMANGAS